VWLFEFEFDLEFLTDRFACVNLFTILDIVDLTTVKYILTKEKPLPRNSSYLCSALNHTFKNLKQHYFKNI